MEEVWSYGRGYYKVFVNDCSLKNKIDRWKDFKLSCRYCLADGTKGWDYIFPSKRYNRIAKLLNLPPKQKNINRVLSGKLSKVANAEKRHIFAKIKSSNSAS